MAVARIRSTRVTPEQAEGQREANRSGRRARASSTLDSRLGREPRPHKHELELVLRPSASAAGSQGSLLPVYENRLPVYTELVKSVLTICRSSPNSQRLSVYTRRPNWLRPPTLIIPCPVTFLSVPWFTPLSSALSTAHRDGFRHLASRMLSFVFSSAAFQGPGLLAGSRSPAAQMRTARKARPCPRRSRHQRQQPASRSSSRPPLNCKT